MEYNVDYFIKKFEAIPEEKWCTYNYMIEDACCANGHCGVNNECSDSAEARALKNLFSGIPILDNCGDEVLEFYDSDTCWKAAYINDGAAIQYPQPTPKQRILAALYDIKKMQQPNYEDITKELAVLPTEETADQPIKEVI